MGAARVRCAIPGSSCRRSRARSAFRSSRPGARGRPGRRLSSGRALLLLDNLEHLLPTAAAASPRFETLAGPRSSSRAGSGSSSRASTCTRSRRSRRRRQSSSSARGPRRSGSTPVTPSRSRSSARGSTTCRSRSSSRPRGRALSRTGRDPLAARRPPRPAEGRPRRRSAPADAPRHDRLVARPARPARAELFARLAVFTRRRDARRGRGGLRRRPGRAQSLLDKSLVRRTRRTRLDARDDPRVRLRAARRRPAADELRDRHAALLRRIRRGLPTGSCAAPARPQALERFASERDNLRAAFERLLDRDPARPSGSSPRSGVLVHARPLPGGPRDCWPPRSRRPRRTDGSQGVRPRRRGTARDASSGDNQEAIGLLEEGLAAPAPPARLASRRTRSASSRSHQFGREEQIRLGEEAIASARAWGSLAARTRDRKPRRRDGPARRDREGNRADWRRHTASAGRRRRLAHGALALNLAEVALRGRRHRDARTGWTSRSSSPGSSTTPAESALPRVNLGWVELLEGDLDHALSSSRRRRRSHEGSAAGARRRGDLGPRPGGGRARRRRPCGAPRGRRGRARRAPPDSTRPTRSRSLLTSTTPARPSARERGRRHGPREHHSISMPRSNSRAA